MTSYATIVEFRLYAPSVPSGTDTTIQLCLDNATAIVRSAMRSMLADPAFDYTAYAAASTAIVLGYDVYYLRLPAYQLGSITLVEYQSASNPSAYSTIEATQWEAQADGRLYRASGWGYSSYGDHPRYRITAVWGYGPTPPGAIKEVTLQLAVNIYRSSDKGGFVEAITSDGSGTMSQVGHLTRLQRQTLEAERDQLITIGV